MKSMMNTIYERKWKFHNSWFSDRDNYSSSGTEWTDYVCLIDNISRWKAVKQNQAHGSQAERHPGGALQRQGGLRNYIKG
jgi:hypothetical protein